MRDASLGDYTVLRDAIGFVEEVTRLKNAVLGIRWTTAKAVDAEKGSYSKENVNTVLGMLQTAGVDKMNGQPINFFIRAHYANRSRENLIELSRKLNKTNRITFTFYSDDQYHTGLWSGTYRRRDPNSTEFREAILYFGVENVYLQVSEHVRSALELTGLPNPRTTTQSSSGAPSSIQLNLFPLIIFVAVEFLGIFVFVRKYKFRAKSK